MPSELEERLNSIIEKYETVTGPTVFRLSVVEDLRWTIEGSNQWQSESARAAENPS